MSAQDVINQFQATAFEFGRSDCCQFVGRMVEELRGHNPMRAFDYSGEHQAEQILAHYGGLADAVTARLGKPIEVSESVDGDVLLVRYAHAARDVEILAVRIGESAVYKTHKGVTAKPLGVAKLAWRVPHG